MGTFVERLLLYYLLTETLTVLQTIHNARPGVWLRPEHILKLYTAVEELVGRQARQGPEGREGREVGKALY